MSRLTSRWSTVREFDQGLLDRFGEVFSGFNIRVSRPSHRAAKRVSGFRCPQSRQSRRLLGTGACRECESFGSVFDHPEMFLVDTPAGPRQRFIVGHAYDGCGATWVEQADKQHGVAFAECPLGTSWYFPTRTRLVFGLPLVGVHHIVERLLDAGYFYETT